MALYPLNTKDRLSLAPPKRSRPRTYYKNSYLPIQRRYQPPKLPTKVHNLPPPYARATPDLLTPLPRYNLLTTTTKLYIRRHNHLFILFHFATFSPLPSFPGECSKSIDQRDSCQIRECFCSGKGISLDPVHEILVFERSAFTSSRFDKRMVEGTGGRECGNGVWNLLRPGGVGLEEKDGGIAI